MRSRKKIKWKAGCYEGITPSEAHSQTGRNVFKSPRSEVETHADFNWRNVAGKHDRHVAARY